MRHRTPALAFLLAAALLLSACSSQQPAFVVLKEIRAVPCPPNLAAPTCVSMAIVNGGPTGDGFCRLYGVDRKPGVEPTPGKFPPGKTTWGPRVQLHHVQGGTTVTRILPWTKPLPTLGFGSTCDPGPRM